MLGRIRKNSKVRVTLFTIASFGLSFMLAASPQTTYAARYGISVADACEQQYGLNMDTYLVAFNVHGWRCGIHGSNGFIEWGGVDLWRYCANKYSGYGAFYDDYNNPYSWYCAPA